MIALTFDIEEFDAPADYGVRMKMEQQMRISVEGTVRILDTLEGLNVKATFFCTANFAELRPDLIQRMVASGHEIASHSYYHSSFQIEDLAKSRETLQRIAGKPVVGYRSPRMGTVGADDLAAAGYLYDSSLNPTFLPGHYNNISKPRTIHRQGLIVEIPASVSPTLRLPLFWLALHIMPLDIYKLLCQRAINDTGFLNIYFHPWEFNDEIANPHYRLPIYIRHNCGEKLVRRLVSLIVHFQSKGTNFVTLSELI